MADMKKIRNFSGVLYPDSESYNCDEVISRIKSKFKQWAFCLHDMDVNDEGELKKRIFTGLVLVMLALLLAVLKFSVSKKMKLRFVRIVG